MTTTDHETNRPAMLAKLADLENEHARAVAGGGEKYVDRHHARGSSRPVSGSSCSSTRGGVPRAVAAGGLGQRLHRRGQRRHRHRRRRGGRAPDHRQRPDGEGWRWEPLDGQEDLPGVPDRRGEPPADDLAGRVRRASRRRRRRSSSRGPAVPRPDPRLGPQTTHSRARVRQLHSRRCLRARDVGLHRHGEGASTGVPGWPAAGEDGHR